MTYSEKVKSARERLLLMQDEIVARLGFNAIASKVFIANELRY